MLYTVSKSFYTIYYTNYGILFIGLYMSKKPTNGMEILITMPLTLKQGFRYDN